MPPQDELSKFLEQNEPDKFLSDNTEEEDELSQFLARNTSPSDNPSLLRNQLNLGIEQDVGRQFIGGGIRVAERGADLANTPQQMLLGQQRDALINPGDAPTPGLTALLSERGRSTAAAGARENLTGADLMRSPQFQELLPEQLQGDPIIFESELTGPISALGVAGFAHDVLADPINILPFGAIGSVVSKTARALFKLKGLQKFRVVALKALGVTEDGIVARKMVRDSRLALLGEKRKVRRKSAQFRQEVEILSGNTDAINPVTRKGLTPLNLAPGTTLAARTIIRKIKGLRKVKGDSFIVDSSDMGGVITEVTEKLGKRLPEPVIPIAPTASASARTRLSVTQDLQKMGMDKPSDEVLEEIETIALARLELTTIPEDVLEGIATQATKLKRIFLETKINELAGGLAPVELNEVWLSYVTHLVSPEAKKKIPKASDLMRQQGKFYNAKHAFQLSRSLRGKTITQINELGRKGEIPGLEGQVFNQFMVDDPATIAMVRGLASEKAIADAELFFEAAAKLGKKAADLPENHQMVRLNLATSSDAREAGITEFFKDQYFDPSVRKSLDRYYEFVTDRDPYGNSLVQQFLAGFDRVQSEWKASTLFIFPAYHSRNFVGNMWNNWLAGMQNPNHYIRAKKFQFGTNSDEIWTIGKHQLPKSQWDEVLADYGASNQFPLYLSLTPGSAPKASRDLFVANIPIPGLRQASRGAFKSGMAMGTMLEDNARIAHFFYRIEKGDDFATAATSMNKYLFDYSPEKMSRFERLKVRRAFPFYTWTRYNLPLQLRAIVDDPKRIAILSDIQQNAQYGVELPEDVEALLGSWVSENWGIPTRNEDGVLEFFTLGGWIPFADLQRTTGDKFGVPVLGNIMGLAVDNASPLLKVPVEIAANYSFFKDRQLEAFSGEKGNFAGLSQLTEKMGMGRLSKRYTIHILKNVRLLAELDRAAAAVGPMYDMNLSDRRGENPFAFTMRYLTGLKKFKTDLQMGDKAKGRAVTKLHRLWTRAKNRGEEDNMRLIEEIRADPARLRKWMEEHADEF